MTVTSSSTSTATYVPGSGPPPLRDVANLKLLSYPSQFRDCAFVDENKDVIFYKSRSGVAKKIGVFEGKGGGVSDSGVDGVETLVDAKQK